MNEAPSQPIAEMTPRRWTFAAGLCLFVAWMAGLVTLVVTSSNPVTLNVEQLRAADCVVAADLKDPSTGEFELVSTIEGSRPPETFRVVEFAEITRPESDRWLLALFEERAGNYSIVPVPYREKELLLVYPASDDVIAQARELLVQD